MSKQTHTCPVCQSNNTKLYKSNVESVYSPHPYNLYQCSNCSHIYISPPPTSSELDKIYKDSYAYDAHLLIQPEKKIRAKAFAKKISQSGDKQSILEIGCMYGFLLRHLKEYGHDCEGVELDSDAVKYCKKNGLKVYQNSLEKFIKTKGKTYDIIIMSHVLEHISDPAQAIQGLSRKLKKNGKLVLIVPNSMATTKKIFGKHWGYWQVPVHIHHYNIKSLGQLMSKNDLTISKSKFFGADSLFFLSTLANITRKKKSAKNLSKTDKAVAKVSSRILQPWLWIGNEDLLIIAEKTKS